MSASSLLDPEATADNAARVWALRSTVPADQVPCSFALLPRSSTATAGRYCYLALSSQLEDLPLDELRPVRLTDGRRAPISREEVFDLLMQGQVGVLAASDRRTGPVTALPTEFLSRRQDLRHLQTYVKYLMLQIALDEMTNVRGAPEELLDELASVWSVPLAITLDLAVLFTLGADRQRYVTDRYTHAVELKRRALLGYLARRGVSSNPLLAI